MIGERRRSSRAGDAGARRDQVADWTAGLELIRLELVLRERVSLSILEAGFEKSSKGHLRRGWCGHVN